MIYISHLIEDEKMKALTARTGAGIESIEFSVAENLDDFEGTMRNYKKRLEYMNCLEDEKMKALTARTGAGIESIEFSVAENLDDFEGTMRNYKKRLEYMNCRELILHGPFLDLNPMAYDSLVVKATQNLDDFEGTMRNYKKRLEYMNCRELILHGPFLDLNPMAYDSLVVKATQIRYEQAYRGAKELGARKLILHSGFIPSVYFLTGWAQRMADFYNRFLDDFIPSVYFLTGWAQRMADFYNRFLDDKDDSVEILMENVMDPLPEPLMNVAEKISHPSFGICFDIGHANCFSQVNGKEWAEALFPYIRHIHVHDNAGDRDSHLPPGEGNAPCDEILKMLCKKADMDCTIECNIRHIHVHDNAGDRDSHLPPGEGNAPCDEILKMLCKKADMDCTIECNRAEDIEKALNNGFIKQVSSAL